VNETYPTGINRLILKIKKDMKNFDQSGTKGELGFADNKKIAIEAIEGIAIRNFRTIKEQTVALGDNITVFSGRNGTMKTSLMGLIAHPFTSTGKDAFGKTLKTSLHEVFRFSPTHDNDDYKYDLLIKTDKEQLLRETVSIYYVAGNTERHRVVVSGAEKGDGNFSYNTSFLNLKRLYPLVDTQAAPDAAKSLKLTAPEAANLKDFYERIFPSSEYENFVPVHEKNIKTTFAPSGEAAVYDWQSISSGEDNLGAIFNRLLGFQRSFKKEQKTGNGILCIDEFESSLHPVAQVKLFDYLYRWSAQYKVQIVISTHSLYLISHIYLKHAANLSADRIIINFVSKSTAVDNNYPILHNPPYSLAYKELTLEDPEKVAEARKIRVFCEDDFAIHFAKKLIKSQNILRVVDFHSTLKPGENSPGTPHSSLTSLCVNFPLLLERSLILFDADVTEADTAKIKDKNLYIKLPDENNLAIERRIIAFIIGLKNDNQFFKKFKKERDAFLAEFKDANISLSLADVVNATKTPINRCKNWAEQDKALFKKYITYYCAQISNNDFRNEFVESINRINSASGLPKLST
jgi:predicted ATPase